ncbi:hypothetical protein [Sphingomonas paucimobilis]|uniref:hypothetical protein n=1 Tax=Sphingomonas paucimobilis TaxID=13689 RepID=UPI0028D64CC9|nr:hypothetical protein [Sphingomonas paucimobilis]
MPNLLSDVAETLEPQQLDQIPCRPSFHAVDGVGTIEQASRRAGKGYVLGVKGNHRVGSWGDKPLVAVRPLQCAHSRSKTQLQC